MTKAWPLHTRYSRTGMPLLAKGDDRLLAIAALYLPLQPLLPRGRPQARANNKNNLPGCENTPTARGKLPTWKFLCGLKPLIQITAIA